MTSARFRTFLVAAIALASTSSLFAQAPQLPVGERHTQPIEIFHNGLGQFTRRISSTNPEAQAFFDQGFQMMYAFAKPEAVRSFRAPTRFGR